MAKKIITGLENFDKLDKIITKGMSKALTRAGVFIKGKAQKKFKALPGVQVRTSKRTGRRYYHFPGKVPGKDPHIRTGRLRISISISPQNPIDEIMVGTNVKYAPFVEIGTSRSRPRPFLAPAALENRKTIEKIFKNILGTDIRVILT